MHSSFVRIQNLFGFFTTVAFCVGAAVALSSMFMLPSVRDVPVDASVKLRNVQVVKGRAHQYYTSKPAEFAFVKFDINADLTPLFNWNTKLVFLYLSASYPGAPVSSSSVSRKTAAKPSYDVNDAVVWDLIVPSKDAAKIALRNVRAKYNINDITGKFAQQNATLTLAWNVQPHIGALRWGEIKVADVELPAVKGKKK